MSELYGAVLLTSLMQETTTFGDLIGITFGNGSFGQFIIGFIKVGIIWTGVIWITTIGMHLYYDQKRRLEFKRLRALRKRCSYYNYRPRRW